LSIYTQIKSKKNQTSSVKAAGGCKWWLGSDSWWLAAASGGCSDSWWLQVVVTFLDLLD
jgi:hypothetical protein